MTMSGRAVGHVFLNGAQLSIHIAT